MYIKNKDLDALAGTVAFEHCRSPDAGTTNNIIIYIYIHITINISIFVYIYIYIYRGQAAAHRDGDRRSERTHETMKQNYILRKPMDSRTLDDTI